MKLSDLPHSMQAAALRQMRKGEPAVKLTDVGRSICTISIPMPPPANHLFVTGKHGKRFCSSEYKAYKATAASAALAAGAVAFHGPIDVTLHLHFPAAHRGHRSDTDSRNKAVLDAMNGILWDDDSQIRDLHNRRFDDAENPRVVILVVPNVERRVSSALPVESEATR